MRRGLPFVAFVFLFGCAPLSTAVIGPMPTRALAMWRGADVREMDVRRDGRLVPVSWPSALGVGLDPTWALVDFHEQSDPRTDVFVVEDLHRVDDGDRFPPLGPLVERALSRHAVWVVAHQQDTDAALAPLGQAPAPETVIDAAAWSTDRIVLTITTTYAVTAPSRPCGGIERPTSTRVLGGIAWSRTYEITEDGTVTPISDDTSRALAAEPEPRCDPQVP